MLNNQDLTYKITHGLNDDAKALRIEVFVEEQGFQNEFDDLDSQCDHLVIYKNEIPVASGRTYQDGDHYIIGRILVKKNYRHLHLGNEVMTCLEKHIVSLGGKRIELSAQVQAKPFYQKLGYLAEGEEYLDEHCPHVHMVKDL